MLRKQGELLSIGKIRERKKWVNKVLQVIPSVCCRGLATGGVGEMPGTVVSKLSDWWYDGVDVAEAQLQDKTLKGNANVNGC